MPDLKSVQTSVVHGHPIIIRDFGDDRQDHSILDVESLQVLDSKPTYAEAVRFARRRQQAARVKAEEEKLSRLEDEDRKTQAETAGGAKEE